MVIDRSSRLLSPTYQFHTFRTHWTLSILQKNSDRFSVDPNGQDSFLKMFGSGYFLSSLKLGVSIILYCTGDSTKDLTFEVEHNEHGRDSYMSVRTGLINSLPYVVDNNF